MKGTPMKQTVVLVNKDHAIETFEELMRKRKCEVMWRGNVDEALRYVLDVTRAALNITYPEPTANAAVNSFRKGRAVLMVRCRTANHAPIIFYQNAYAAFLERDPRKPIYMYSAIAIHEHVAEVKVVERGDDRIGVSVEFCRTRVWGERPYWIEATEPARLTLITRHAERIKRLGLYPAWAIDEIIKNSNLHAALFMSLRSLRHEKIGGHNFTIAIITAAPLGVLTELISGRVVYVIKNDALQHPLIMTAFVRMNWSRPFSRRQLQAFCPIRFCEFISKATAQDMEQLSQLLVLSAEVEQLVYKALLLVERMPAIADVVREAINSIESRYSAMHRIEEYSILLTARQILHWMMQRCKTAGHENKGDIEMLAAKLEATSSLGWRTREYTSKSDVEAAVCQLARNAGLRDEIARELTGLRDALGQIVNDADKADVEDEAAARFAKRLLVK